MIIELTFKFKKNDKEFYTKFWSLDKSMIYKNSIGAFWYENGLSPILDHDIGENLFNDDYPHYICNYSMDLPDKRLEKLHDEPYRITVFDNPECKGHPCDMWHRLSRQIDFYTALYKVVIL